jgi:hypothetical protein
MENESITFDDFWRKFFEIAEKQNYDKLQAKAIWYALTPLEREAAYSDLLEMEDFELGKILIEPFKYLMNFKDD